MNNLKRLMMEFSILGMEPEAIEAENGLEFPEIDPAAVAPEEEYELDADGNPVLDEMGNPVPKKPKESCSCDHREDDLAASATPPAGGIMVRNGEPMAGATMPGAPIGEPSVAQLPPEDEFEFI